MAPPQFIRKLFNRNRQQPQTTTRAPMLPPAPAARSINIIPNWSRAVLESVGISPSTCRVDGSRTNPKYLPTLPSDYQCLYSKLSGPEPNNTSSSVSGPQSQSPFFTQLPPEIRHLVYLHAFGNRRIHLDFDFNPELGQWTWWHRVCHEAQHCPDGTFLCPEYAGAEDAMLNLTLGGWVQERFEYKMDALNWLTCCRRGYQESLPILYTSNTFVLTHGIDQLFRLSRVMPREHLALIASLSVEIDIYRVHKGPPNMDPRFRPFYEGIFAILLRDLPNVRELRISIAGLPSRSGRSIQWSDDEEWAWIAPWEELTRSRNWRSLVIALPRAWLSDFERVVERRSTVEQEKRYRLVVGVDVLPRGW
ncbi:hypothetical protein BBP40_008525 [Aspergillus hancockii]|nr:hypothetical protein BBP40_008525 [Aspergillus hancockii]